MARVPQPLGAWTLLALASSIYLQAAFILGTIGIVYRGDPEDVGIPWVKQILAIVLFIVYLILRKQKEPP